MYLRYEEKSLTAKCFMLLAAAARFYYAVCFYAEMHLRILAIFLFDIASWINAEQTTLTQVPR